MEDDARHVVAGTRVQRHLNQPFGARLGGRLSQDFVAQRFVGQRTSQPVRRKEDSIAGAKVHVDDVGAVADFLGAQILPEDVSVPMVFEIFPADRLGFEERLRKIVVGGDALDFSVSNQIGAAVAQVGEIHAPTAAQTQDDRGSHALRVGVGIAFVKDQIVGGQNGASDRLANFARLREVVREMGQFSRDDVDGELAGSLPRGLPPHAVGDDEERNVSIDEDAVLVVFPHRTDGTHGADAQAERIAGGAVSIGGRRLSGPLSDHLVQFVEESHGSRATQRQGSGFRNVPTGQYKRLDWHLQKAEREGKVEGESSGIG